MITKSRFVSSGHKQKLQFTAVILLLWELDTGVWWYLGIILAWEHHWPHAAPAPGTWPSASSSSSCSRVSDCHQLAAAHVSPTVTAMKIFDHTQHNLINPLLSFISLLGNSEKKKIRKKVKKILIMLTEKLLFFCTFSNIHFYKILNTSNYLAIFR